jgi:branched-chain amino acid transport system substrate-binding protein
MNAVLTGQASVAYLSSRNIPVISSEGASNWFYEHPNYFPLFASGDPTLKSVFDVAVNSAKANGKSKIGTFNCIEAAMCSAVYDKAPGYAQEFGVALVYRGQGSLVQPDFTSACQSAKDAGVEVLAMYMDGNSIQRFGKSCNSVGFHPLYVVQGFGLTPALASDPNLDGLQGTLVTIPWLEMGNPIVAEFDQMLRQYAPGVPPSAPTLEGWIAGKVFEAAVAATDDPTTSVGIMNGMNSINGNDFSGTTYPLSFPAGQTAAKQYCVWTATISGGQYVSDGAAPVACGTGG